MSFYLIADNIEGFLADQDLVASRIFLNAFGGVDAVANGGVFQALLGADQSQHGFAQMDAGPEGQVNLNETAIAENASPRSCATSSA